MTEDDDLMNELRELEDRFGVRDNPPVTVVIRDEVVDSDGRVVETRVQEIEL